MITTQIELDVSPGGIAPVIHVSQYDTGSRTLQFNLIATAGDLILPTGTKAEIRGTKPDGNGFSYDALINGKTVTADVTEQMTAAAGKAVCEIVLYTGMPAREDAEASSDFTQLCTAYFILYVERAALDKDTVKSGSEIKQLITVIDRTDELLAAAETMDDAKESIRQMTENTRSEMNQLAESIEQNAQELADQSAASARAAAQSAQAADRTLQTVEAKGQQISQIALNSDTLARTALEKATNAENESAETSNSVDNLNRAIARLNLLTQGKVDDAYVEDGFLYMTSDGDVVVGPLGPFSGTGGGGGGTSVPFPDHCTGRLPPYHHKLVFRGRRYPDRQRHHESDGWRCGEGHDRCEAGRRYCGCWSVPVCRIFCGEDQRGGYLRKQPNAELLHHGSCADTDLGIR